MILRYCLILLSILMFAESAYALRCGTKLISRGDSRFKVQNLCGGPSDVRTRTILRSGIPSRAQRIYRSSKNRTYDDELLLHQESIVEVQIEEWFYNFGPNRFAQIIKFENGVVVDIDESGYGFVE